MNTSIIQNQQEIYRSQFLEHGDSPEGTYNQNEIIQHLRFERLLKNLNLSSEAYADATLHDVGCGICDLYPYIRAQQPGLKYSGTDIIAEMKDLAVKKYPDIEYLVRNVLEDGVQDKYDFVVLSGTFNIPGQSSESDWRAFSREMIRKMYSMANYGIAFNFVTSHVDYRHDDMFYENPADILDYCIRNLSRHVILDHGYALFEHTVTVLTPDFLKKQHTDACLHRYIKSRS